ncbi:MAG: ureidoglycolate lyase [Pseudomonadota bacterium]
MTDIFIQPLTREIFFHYGDVIDCAGTPDKMINAGLCGRYHDVASLETVGGRLGLSLFDAKPRALPLELDLMERHPDGSQTFIPMTEHPFLVIVAPDHGGRPGKPMALLAAPGQGVNYHRAIWHGVLTPLHAPGRFAVIDRIGIGENLEEFRFDTPYTIRAQPV